MCLTAGLSVYTAAEGQQTSAGLSAFRLVGAWCLALASCRDARKMTCNLTADVYSACAASSWGDVCLSWPRDRGTLVCWRALAYRQIGMPLAGFHVVRRLLTGGGRAVGTRADHSASPYTALLRMCMCVCVLLRREVSAAEEHARTSRLILGREG